MKEKVAGTHHWQEIVCEKSIFSYELIADDPNEAAGCQL